MMNRDKGFVGKHTNQLYTGFFNVALETALIIGQKAVACLE